MGVRLVSPAPSPGPLRQAVGAAHAAFQSVALPLLADFERRRGTQLVATLDTTAGRAADLLVNDAQVHRLREFCAGRWQSEPDALTAARSALDAIDALLSGKTMLTKAEVMA